MSLSFHIDFCGQCREAFEFYSKHLGGNIGTMLSFRDSPASSSIPGARQDEIIHANISIHGVELAGADLAPEQYQRPTGFYVLLSLTTDAQVKSAFSALEVGGDVIFPPQKTFWSSCYGIVVDQFGVPWKLNCGT
ncbi:VOC family protein [Gilvimarinus polysaccharolyticus]|uniref:VOC family protein n=1 Tax=Gilvimarinus polysaccharolyticus TaxID=863921 RepID=UPI0006738FED|nr:VOC family protein [Gilvimarinus polysaccharolyticus]